MVLFDWVELIEIVLGANMVWNIFLKPLIVLFTSDLEAISHICWVSFEQFIIVTFESKSHPETQIHQIYWVFRSRFVKFLII